MHDIIITSEIPSVRKKKRESQPPVHLSILHGLLLLVSRKFREHILEFIDRRRHQSGKRFEGRFIGCTRVSSNTILVTQTVHAPKREKTNRVGANFFVMLKLAAASAEASSPMTFVRRGKSFCSSLSLCGRRCSITDLRMATCCWEPGLWDSMSYNNSLTFYRVENISTGDPNDIGRPT